MAVVVGGSKCNLITGYAEGEDTNVNYGKNHWLAQTFTVPAQTIIWRCRFKSWTNIGAEFYNFALYNTDAFGKPTGAPISTTTLSPTGEHFYSPGKWRRFDFGAFPQVPAGQYAITVSIPTGVNTTGWKLRADATAPTYALGKAYKSTDSGSSWSEIPNTDLMFEVWGWEPPPDPPPSPAISNWAPLGLTMDDEIGAMEIVVTTDIPVHLFMRWTNQQPLVHKATKLVRGIRLADGERYCFVAFTENEQEEAGDTLIHTFIKPDWTICETRWFYFIGTKQAEEQPSASPIFYFHREGVEMYVISLGKLGEAEILFGNVKLKEGTGITITRDDPDNALEIASTIPAYEGFRNHWNKLDPDGQIAGSLGWLFDEVHFSTTGSGLKGALYTAPQRCWGLVSPHSCQFKITRGPAAGGNPNSWFCAVKDDPDIHNNPLQEHIGFRSGPTDLIYCTNADGTNRTQTNTGISMFPPKWVKWIRDPAQIRFFVDGVLVATHNTNLPALTNSAFFTFMLQGSSAFVRSVYMTCPMLGVD